MTASHWILRLFLIRMSVALPRCDPAVIPLLLDLLQTESPAELKFFLIPLRHHLVQVFSQVYAIVFGLEEVLANLVKYLREGPLPELNLIVIVDHLRSDKRCLIDIDPPADHGIISELGLDSDVLLITSHEQSLRISEFYNGQHDYENR